MNYVRDVSTTSHTTYVATKTHPMLAERTTVTFCNSVGRIKQHMQCTETQMSYSIRRQQQTSAFSDRSETKRSEEIRQASWMRMNMCN